jgi:hypothetical protein
MWIEVITIGAAPDVQLVCDVCGSAFQLNGGRAPTRDAVWLAASTAGWALTAQDPDRHVCATC